MFRLNWMCLLWPFVMVLFTLYIYRVPNYGKRKSRHAESHIPSPSWFYDRRAAGREDVDNETRHHISKLTLICYSKYIIYEQEEQIAHVITPTHPAILKMTPLWKHMKNEKMLNYEQGVKSLGKKYINRHESPQQQPHTRLTHIHGFINCGC